MDLFGCVNNVNKRSNQYKEILAIFKNKNRKRIVFGVGQILYKNKTAMLPRTVLVLEADKSKYCTEVLH